jgi:hypothetical protein
VENWKSMENHYFLVWPKMHGDGGHKSS